MISKLKLKVWLICFTVVTPYISHKVFAQDIQPKADLTVGQSVSIHQTRNPVDKSYRKMIAGMDLFERMHHLAPNAKLKFKLLPRRVDTNMSDIKMSLRGDSQSTTISIAENNTFTLDRIQWALDENASVSPNRTAGSLTWRTDIRTEGLPPHTRRLGDLRLECQVGREADLISNSQEFLGAIINSISSIIDYCDGIQTNYLFFSERPIFNVTLVHNGRRHSLAVDELYAGISYRGADLSSISRCDCQVLLDRTFFLPLGDKSWPDDTLVEFEFMY